MWRKFKHFSLFIVCMLIAWECYLGVEIIRFSQVNETPVSDVAIVLGAAIRHNFPSPVFEERIKHAVYLYKKGIIKKIIFTGGVGKGQQYAEAEVARNYALKQGINALDILIENTSKTTQKNLVEAQKLLQKHSLQSVILVSDPLHMKRAITIAKDLGIHVSSSPTQTSRYKSLENKLKFLWRELYFYQHYLLTKT